jgi:hypothetical protein
MTYLLKISRIKLFAILYGLPIGVMLMLPTSLLISNDIEGVIVSAIGFSYCMGAYLLWAWTIGSRLIRSLDANLTSKLEYLLFKIAFTVVIIESLLINAGVILTSMKIEIGLLYFLLLIFSFATMAAFICIGGFNAKYLKMKETGHAVKKGDYAGDAGLFIVYPIGLWFLQPRIRRVFGYN